MKLPWSAPYVVSYFVYLQKMRTSCCRRLFFHSYCAFLFMLFFQDLETLKSTDKICRQLIYHLTPHSKWLRKSMTRRKAQAWWETFPVLHAIKTSECADMVLIISFIYSSLYYIIVRGWVAAMKCTTIRI